MDARAADVYLFQTGVNNVLTSTFGCDPTNADMRQWCISFSTALTLVNTATDNAIIYITTARAMLDQLDGFYGKIGIIKLRAWTPIFNYFLNLTTTINPYLLAMKTNYTATFNSTNSTLTYICATELVPIANTNDCQVCPGGICISFPCQPSWSFRSACSNISTFASVIANAQAKGQEIATRVSSLSDFVLDILTGLFAMQSPQFQYQDPYQPNYQPNFPNPSTYLPWTNLDLSLPYGTQKFPSSSVFDKFISKIRVCAWVDAAKVLSNDWKFPYN
jgi:hypothetical protein